MDVYHFDHQNDVFRPTPWYIWCTSGDMHVVAKGLWSTMRPIRRRATHLNEYAIPLNRTWTDHGYGLGRGILSMLHVLFLMAHVACQWDVRRMTISFFFLKLFSP